MSKRTMDRELVSNRAHLAAQVGNATGVIEFDGNRLVVTIWTIKHRVCCVNAVYSSMNEYCWDGN